MKELNQFARNRHISASEKPKDQVSFETSGYSSKLDWLSAGCIAKPKLQKPEVKKVISRPKAVESVTVSPEEKKILPDLRSRKDIVVQDGEEEAEVIISESDVDDEKILEDFEKLNKVEPILATNNSSIDPEGDAFKDEIKSTTKYSSAFDLPEDIFDDVEESTIDLSSYINK
jgi:hypothetical protein